MTDATRRSTRRRRITYALSFVAHPRFRRIWSAGLLAAEGATVYSTSTVKNASWLTRVLTLLGLSAWPGCTPVCEPPLSNERTSVQDVSLPVVWTSPAGTQLTLLLTDQPYAISQAALDRVMRVLADQAGLQVNVERIADSGLPAGERLPAGEVTAVGCALPWSGSGPVVGVVTVWDTGLGYGFIANCTALLRKTVVINRLRAERVAIGPITADDDVALTLLHEVGHWLGVPARDFHRSALDAEDGSAHCTNARCVMYKGSRVGLCAILANLTTGLPFQFCEDCAEELREEQARRSAGL
jgi:predicted Zn-dependent protease